METVLNKKVVFPQVLRLMGISRSPIFALFSRTLRIRDTLRAFAAQRGFEEEATELVPAPVNISMTTSQIQNGWSPLSERSFER